MQNVLLCFPFHLAIFFILLKNKDIHICIHMYVNVSEWKQVCAQMSIPAFGVSGSRAWKIPETLRALPSFSVEF